MAGTPDRHDATAEPSQGTHEPIRYPSNHVLAVIDTRDQATAVAAALTAGGFLDSEIDVGTGAARADELDATTGRSGLAGMLISLAERLGLTDEEMETKNLYERAMRDDRFVVLVAAATDDRKDRATQILRDHGAHTVAFLGKHTIEHIVPPNRK